MATTALTASSSGLAVLTQERLKLDSTKSLFDAELRRLVESVHHVKRQTAAPEAPLNAINIASQVAKQPKDNAQSVKFEEIANGVSAALAAEKKVPNNIEKANDPTPSSPTKITAPTRAKTVRFSIKATKSASRLTLNKASNPSLSRLSLNATPVPPLPQSLPPINVEQKLAAMRIPAAIGHTTNATHQRLWIERIQQVLEKYDLHLPPAYFIEKLVTFGETLTHTCEQHDVALRYCFAPAVERIAQLSKTLQLKDNNDNGTKFGLYATEEDPEKLEEQRRNNILANHLVALSFRARLGALQCQLHRFKEKLEPEAMFTLRDKLVRIAEQAESFASMRDTIHMAATYLMHSIADALANNDHFDHAASVLRDWLPKSTVKHGTLIRICHLYIKSQNYAAGLELLANADIQSHPNLRMMQNFFSYKSGGLSKIFDDDAETRQAQHDLQVAENERRLVAQAKAQRSKRKTTQLPDVHDKQKEQELQNRRNNLMCSRVMSLLENFNSVGEQISQLAILLNAHLTLGLATFDSSVPLYESNLLSVTYDLIVSKASPSSDEYKKRATENSGIPTHVHFRSNTVSAIGAEKFLMAIRLFYYYKDQTKFKIVTEHLLAYHNDLFNSSQQLEIRVRQAVSHGDMTSMGPLLLSNSEEIKHLPEVFAADVIQKMAEDIMTLDASLLQLLYRMSCSLPHPNLCEQVKIVLVLATKLDHHTAIPILDQSLRFLTLARDRALFAATTLDTLTCSAHLAGISHSDNQSLHGRRTLALAQMQCQLLTAIHSTHLQMDQSEATLNAIIKSHGRDIYAKIMVHIDYVASCKLSAISQRKYLDEAIRLIKLALEMERRLYKSATTPHKDGSPRVVRKGAAFITLAYDVMDHEQEPYAIQVLCKVASGRAITLKDTEYEGSSQSYLYEPGVEIIVRGLSSSSEYIFAFALYSQDGSLLRITNTTKPIRAAAPLPLTRMWAYLGVVAMKNHLTDYVLLAYDNLRDLLPNSSLDVVLRTDLLQLTFDWTLVKFGVIQTKEERLYLIEELFRVADVSQFDNKMDMAIFGLLHQSLMPLLEEPLVEDIPIFNRYLNLLDRVMNNPDTKSLLCNAYAAITFVVSQTLWKHNDRNGARQRLAESHQVLHRYFNDQFQTDAHIATDSIVSLLETTATQKRTVAEQHKRSYDEWVFHAVKATQPKGRIGQYGIAVTVLDVLTECFDSLTILKDEMLIEQDSSTTTTTNAIVNLDNVTAPRSLITGFKDLLNAMNRNGIGSAFDQLSRVRVHPRYVELSCRLAEMALRRGDREQVSRITAAVLEWLDKRNDATLHPYDKSEEDHRHFAFYTAFFGKKRRLARRLLGKNGASKSVPGIQRVHGKPAAPSDTTVQRERRPSAGSLTTTSHPKLRHAQSASTHGSHSGPSSQQHSRSATPTHSNTASVGALHRDTEWATHVLRNQLPHLWMRRRFRVHLRDMLHTEGPMRARLMSVLGTSLLEQFVQGNANSSLQDWTELCFTDVAVPLVATSSNAIDATNAQQKIFEIFRCFSQSVVLAARYRVWSQVHESCRLMWHARQALNVHPVEDEWRAFYMAGTCLVESLENKSMRPHLDWSRLFVMSALQLCYQVNAWNEGLELATLFQKLSDQQFTAHLLPIVESLGKQELQETGENNVFNQTLSHFPCNDSNSWQLQIFEQKVTALHLSKRRDCVLLIPVPDKDVLLADLQVFANNNPKGSLAAKAQLLCGNVWLYSGNTKLAAQWWSKAVQSALDDRITIPLWRKQIQLVASSTPGARLFAVQVLVKMARFCYCQLLDKWHELLQFAAALLISLPTDCFIDMNADLFDSLSYITDSLMAHSSVYPVAGLLQRLSKVGAKQFQGSLEALRKVDILHARFCVLQGDLSGALTKLARKHRHLCPFSGFLLPSAADSELVSEFKNDEQSLKNDQIIRSFLNAALNGENGADVWSLAIQIGIQYCQAAEHWTKCQSSVSQKLGRKSRSVSGVLSNSKTASSKESLHRSEESLVKSSNAQLNKLKENYLQWYELLSMAESGFGRLEQPSLRTILSFAVLLHKSYQWQKMLDLLTPLSCTEPSLIEWFQLRVLLFIACSHLKVKYLSQFKEQLLQQLSQVSLLRLWMLQSEDSPNSEAVWNALEPWLIENQLDLLTNNLLIQSVQTAFESETVEERRITLLSWLRSAAKQWPTFQPYSVFSTLLLNTKILQDVTMEKINFPLLISRRQLHAALIIEAKYINQMESWQQCLEKILQGNVVYDYYALLKVLYALMPHLNGGRLAALCLTTVKVQEQSKLLTKHLEFGSLFEELIKEYSGNPLKELALNLKVIAAEKILCLRSDFIQQFGVNPELTIENPPLYCYSWIPNTSEKYLKCHLFYWKPSSGSGNVKSSKTNLTSANAKLPHIQVEMQWPKDFIGHILDATHRLLQDLASKEEAVLQKRFSIMLQGVQQKLLEVGTLHILVKETTKSRSKEDLRKVSLPPVFSKETLEQILQFFGNVETNSTDKSNSVFSWIIDTLSAASTPSVHSSTELAASVTTSERKNTFMAFKQPAFPVRTLIANGQQTPALTPGVSFGAHGPPTMNKRRTSASKQRASETSLTLEDALNTIASARPHTSKGKVEDDYIRNLQQQIYLLELETRYLRSSAGKQAPARSENEGNEEAQTQDNELQERPTQFQNSFKHQNSSGFGSSRGIYNQLQEQHMAELREMRNKIVSTEGDLKREQMARQDLEREANEAKKHNRSVQDRLVAEKDHLVGENISLSKRLDSLQNDKQRQEQSYNRLLQDKERQQKQVTILNSELVRRDEKITELQALNESLTQQMNQQKKVIESHLRKIDELNQTIRRTDVHELVLTIKEQKEELAALQAQIKQLEMAKNYEVILRQKTSQECEDMVKTVAAIQQDLQEANRKLKHETEKHEEKLKRKQETAREQDALNDEIARLNEALVAERIVIENKEQSSINLSRQLADKDMMIGHLQEEKQHLEEQVNDLLARMSIQETEFVKLGQEKSMLLDKVGEIQMQLDVKSASLTRVQDERNDIKVKLETLQKDLNELQSNDFKSLVSTNAKVADSISALASHLPSTRA